jgi:hypothetical protein
MKILEAKHQGDVLFLKVAEQPDVSKLKELEYTASRGTVLQHGEALGHYHTIPQQDGYKAYLMGVDDSVKKMAIFVYKPTTVVHEEHNSIVLDEGIWISSTQREKSSGLTRQVFD